YRKVHVQRGAVVASPAKGSRHRSRVGGIHSHFRGEEAQAAALHLQLRGAIASLGSDEGVIVRVRGSSDVQPRDQAGQRRRTDRRGNARRGGETIVSGACVIAVGRARIVGAVDIADAGGVVRRKVDF